MKKKLYEKKEAILNAKDFNEVMDIQYVKLVASLLVTIRYIIIQL